MNIVDLQEVSIMQIDLAGFVVLFLLSKASEVLLEFLLLKFWQWVLREEHLQRFGISCKLQLLIFYMDWLLQKTPLQQLSDQKEGRGKDF